ncbi:MAG: hypothetical protein AAGN66_04980 [Acidobacteriota bacterium]
MSSLQFVTLIASVLHIGACVVVGVRLLVLARRTREVPEFLMGTSFVAAGAALFFFLVALGREPGSEAAANAVFGARAMLVVSLVTVLLLAWRVFRPDVLWARILVIGGSLVLVSYPFLDATPAEGDVVHPVYWLVRFGQIVPYAWAASEAYLYQRDLRRRQRLGLAPEGLLATQVMLWSVGLGVSGLIYLWNTLAIWTRVHQGLALPVTVVTSILGLVVAVTLWLAFFPPASWRGDEGATP